MRQQTDTGEHFSRGDAILIPIVAPQVRFAIGEPSSGGANEQSQKSARSRI